MPRVAPEARARLEGARRTQILEAAAQVFSRKGFDRATIADIARAARLAEGSIYNYFRSKEELLVHIPRQLVQPALTPLLEQMAAPATPEELEALLLRVGTVAVERVRTNTKFLKVFLSALPHLSPAVRETYVLHLLPPVYVSAALERMLREGIRRGYLRRDLNPVIAARAVPGMLLVTLMIQEVLLGRRVVPYSYDKIIAETVRVFLYGATARPRAARSPAVLRAQGGTDSRER